MGNDGVVRTKNVTTRRTDDEVGVQGFPPLLFLLLRLFSCHPTYLLGGPLALPPPSPTEVVPRRLRLPMSPEHPQRSQSCWMSTKWFQVRDRNTCKGRVHLPSWKASGVTLACCLRGDDTLLVCDTVGHWVFA